MGFEGGEVMMIMTMMVLYSIISRLPLTCQKTDFDGVMGSSSSAPQAWIRISRILRLMNTVEFVCFLHSAMVQVGSKANPNKNNGFVYPKAELCHSGEGDAMESIRGPCRHRLDFIP